MNDTKIASLPNIRRVSMSAACCILTLLACSLLSVPAAAQVRSDFNGDGNPDLVWQNSSTGDVTVWYMNGATWTGNWAYIARGVPLAWKIVGAADLNGDSKTDLVWQNRSTGDVTVWYMNGATWTGNWAYIARGVPLAWKIVGIADIGGGNVPLGGDGSPDLIWQNSSTGDVTVWYMNGATWSGNWDYLARGVPLAWKIVGIADLAGGNVPLEGDGSPDLIWQNSSTGDVTVWHMNGATWTGDWDSVAQGVPLGWRIVTIMDANKDGQLDLVWQNTTTGDITVWYMSGDQWGGSWDFIAHSVPTEWKIDPTG